MTTIQERIEELRRDRERIAREKAQLLAKAMQAFCLSLEEMVKNDED